MLLEEWWFEPFVATLAFALFINVYAYWERRQGLSAYQSFIVVNVLDPRQWGPVISSGVAYWVGMGLMRVVTTQVVPRAETLTPIGFIGDWMSLGKLACELIAGIFLYDAVFFAVHWGMHNNRRLKLVHHRHHSHKPLECCDTLRHSLLDGTLQVLVNILVQQYTPWGSVKSRLARLLHNILVVWMLVESHSRVPQGYVWRRFCVGVREHWRHHHYHNTNYVDGDSCRHRFQQFFGYLDDLLLALNGPVQASNQQNGQTASREKR